MSHTWESSNYNDLQYCVPTELVAYRDDTRYEVWVGCRGLSRYEIIPHRPYFSGDTRPAVRYEYKAVLFRHSGEQLVLRSDSKIDLCRVVSNCIEFEEFTFDSPQDAFMLGAMIGELP